MTIDFRLIGIIGDVGVHDALEEQRHGGRLDRHTALLFFFTLKEIDTVKPHAIIEHEQSNNKPLYFFTLFLWSRGLARDMRDPLWVSSFVMLGTGTE